MYFMSSESLSFQKVYYIRKILFKDFNEQALFSAEEQSRNVQCERTLLNYYRWGGRRVVRATHNNTATLGNGRITILQINVVVSLE